VIPALLLLIGLAAPPSSPTVVKAEPAAELEAKFRQSEGWIGADGAYSVPLTDKRTLWLFSDTWVGSIRDEKRKPIGLANNSIGIEDGRGAEMKLSFAIRKDADGKPKAIFAPPDGEGWFWLFAGYHEAGKLYVFLPKFEKAKGTGAFAFRGVGLWLGTVSNPLDEPSRWKIEYQQVPFGEFEKSPRRSFGAAVLRVKDHVFIYGSEEKPGKPFASRRLLVARAPAQRLADFDSWRFYANGEWKTDPKDATGQIEKLGSEMSVSYLPGLRKYALVYSENGLSDRILGRFADAPEGPWTEPGLLYTCPEMKKDRKNFTYAAKAHAHLAKGNELVISYAVNSFELAPVINNAELYWPRFVRVSLK